MRHNHSYNTRFYDQRRDVRESYRPRGRGRSQGATSRDPNSAQLVDLGNQGEYMQDENALCVVPGQHINQPVANNVFENVPRPLTLDEMLFDVGNNLNLNVIPQNVQVNPGVLVDNLELCPRYVDGCDGVSISESEALQLNVPPFQAVPQQCQPNYNNPFLSPYNPPNFHGEASFGRPAGLDHSGRSDLFLGYPAQVGNVSAQPNLTPANNFDMSQLVNVLENIKDEFSMFKQQIPELVRDELTRSELARSEIVSQPIIAKIKQEAQPPQLSLRNRAESVQSLNSFSNARSKRSKFFGSTQFRDLPIFDGDYNNTHPKDFIQNLKLFFEVNEASDAVMINEAGRLLVADAQVWYQVYKGTWVDFNEFCQSFLSHFWSPTLQDRLRITMLTPNNQDALSGDYATYFLRQVRIVRYFDEPPSESLVISAVTARFPREVVFAISQLNPKTISSVLSLLQSFDFLNSQSQPPLVIKPATSVDPKNSVFQPRGIPQQAAHRHPSNNVRPQYNYRPTQSYVQPQPAAKQGPSAQAAFYSVEEIDFSVPPPSEDTVNPTPFP